MTYVLTINKNMIISSRCKAGNVINLNCYVVHFQFGPQNGRKLDKLYLAEYYKLAGIKYTNI